MPCSILFWDALCPLSRILIWNMMKEIWHDNCNIYDWFLFSFLFYNRNNIFPKSLIILFSKTIYSKHAEWYLDFYSSEEKNHIIISHIKYLSSLAVKPGEIQLDMTAPNQGECIAYNAKTDKWLPLDCSLPKLFTCDRREYFYFYRFFCWNIWVFRFGISQYNCQCKVPTKW